MKQLSKKISNSTLAVNINGTIPTATVGEYRNAIYPVSKDEKTGVRVSKWGSFKIVRGGVTPRHRDVMDAIITKCMKSQYVRNSITGEDEIHLLYDAKEVLEFLNTTSTYSWLKGMLLDLQATVITIERKDGSWPDSWNLLSFNGDSKIDAVREPWQKQAKLKKIVLSPGTVKWMQQDIKIFVNEEVVNQVMLLKNQVSKSVARWFLSHANGQNHPIESVLEAVGCKIDAKEIKRRASQLEEDRDGLHALGISLGNNINSRRIGGVWFEN